MSVADSGVSNIGILYSVHSIVIEHLKKLILIKHCQEK